VSKWRLHTHAGYLLTDGHGWYATRKDGKWCWGDLGSAYEFRSLSQADWLAKRLREELPDAVSIKDPRIM